MSSELTIAGLALPNQKWDASANLERLRRWATLAAHRGADLVITPEAYLDGYCLTEASEPSRQPQVRERYPSVAHEWLDSPALTDVADLARELGIHLICGGIERLNGRYYNTAFFFGPGGPIGRYHKTHIGWERLLHTPGDSLPLFATPWGPIGILVCFDRQFPEAARALALAGALLIVVPSNGMYGGINDTMMATRAYENSSYLAFVHPQDCLILSPRGKLLAANEEPGREEVVVRRLDLARALELRQQPENLLSERRPDLYTCLGADSLKARL